MPLPLPVRTPRAPFDADGHAARLIVLIRHDFPDMLPQVLSDIWMRGRDAALAVITTLATPTALYYTQVGERPPLEYWFEPGTAERFAYGYVGAVAEGDARECALLLEDFSRAGEDEVRRAMILMATSAAQSMDIMDRIAGVEAAIGAF